MNRWSVLLGAGALLGLLGGGTTACSLLLSDGAAQCSTTGDCEGKGFTGYTCGGEGVCVAPQTAQIVTPADASTACNSTEECTAQNGGRPSICRSRGTSQCESLVTDECTEVVGDYKDPNTVFIGYHTIEKSYDQFEAFYSAVHWREAQLARAEIMEALPGGLPGGPNGARRPLTFIKCESADKPALQTKIAQHLIQIGAPIISSTTFDSVIRFHTEVTAQNKRVFNTCSICGATEVRRLASGTGDTSLVFQVYPPATMAAPAQAARLTDFEPMVRADAQFTGGDVRVAVVQPDYADTTVADILDNMVVNGKPARDPANAANVLVARWRWQVGDYDAAVQPVLAQKPHVIIFAVPNAESYRLLTPLLEAGWPAGAMKPFYSHSILGLELLPDLIGPNEDLRRRISGVYYLWDVAEEPSRLQEYSSRYEKMFPGLSAPYAYAYDEIYMLAYAIVAAGPTQKVTADDVIRGMPKLQAGDTVWAGPADLLLGMSALNNVGKISLHGLNAAIYKADLNRGVIPVDSEIWRTCRDQGSPFEYFTGQVYSFDKKTMSGPFPACP